MERASITGKTRGSPSIICDGCEDKDSTHICTECNIYFCWECMRIHKKGNIYKTHTITSLTEVEIPTNKSTSSQFGSQYKEAFCMEHTTRHLAYICETCVLPLCDQCKISHKGHKFITTDHGVGLLQKLCLKTMPQILELLQELEQLKDAVPEKLQLYRQARELVQDWRNDIVSTTNEEADNLASVLDMQIHKIEKHIKDADSTLNEYVTKAGDKMTKLTEMSSISDATTILVNMNDCTKEMNEIKSFIETYEKQKAATTIDTILPKVNRLEDVKDSVKEFFRDTRKGSFATLADDIEIPEPNGDGYSISECKHIDTEMLVLYSWYYARDVQVFNIETGSLKSFATEMKIWSMASLSSEEHVVIDTRRKLHLLDSQFRIVSTFQNDGEYEPAAVCSESPDSCIVQERSTEKNTIKRFRRFKVINNNFNVEELGKADMDFEHIEMSLNKERTVLSTIEGERDFSFLSLNSMTSSSVELENDQLDEIETALSDFEDRIFIGDDAGQIFIHDSEGQYLGNIDTGGDVVDGFAIKGSTLFASVRQDDEVHIKVYEIAQ